MSQEFMDAELFADFIIEAKEHLETIEPNLLELEKVPDNLGLLNEIFRPMHSLKGASGFLGLNRMNQLAHKAENILDELRRGAMVITSEIMDVILAATDALRQMVDNLERTNTEGEVEISHILTQIDALMAGEASAAPPPAKTPTAEADAACQEGAAQQGEAPAAPARQTEAAPLSGFAAGMTPKEWLASLPLLPAYALSAFGEGHIKDFIEESIEIIENLNTGLLRLEETPAGQEDLVNDLFRFFHNLKGNSGILGYHELNGITHEAETLLNNVRKGELVPSRELIDLLLFVVDVMESLVRCIDVHSGQVRPPDTAEALLHLQRVVAGNGTPASGGPQAAHDDAPDSPQSSPAATLPSAEKEAVEVVMPVIIPVGAEGPDEDIFSGAVRQQMEIIRAAMETLHKDGTHKESIDALFRCLQAVKNACSFVNLNDIKVYVERTAGIVDSARGSDMDFSLLLDMLRQEIDIIQEMLDKHLTDPGSAVTGTERGKPETQAPEHGQAREEPPARIASPPAAQGPPAETPVSPAQAAAKPSASPQAAKPAAPGAPANNDAAKGSSTIRVDHEKLDHLMNLIGELIINRNRYSLIARHLEEGGAEVDVSQVAQSLSETTYAMARISDDLQDTIMKVRMVPVASVFSRFPRLVRDLSRKSGKEVDLILEGEETELDKSVVEVIGDPMVHLIRNAMDHGIESEADRVAGGKPPKGRVVLRAYHKGNSVAIEIEDDGKGIDPEKMREVGVRKGIISPEDARLLDDREAMELIFAPGFSSAEQITDISGRGVGMDVVRTNIKNLKGSVNISSEVGKGTRFTLSLPLTLAIIDALMVNVSGEMFAIPLDAVSETTKLESRRLTDVKGRKAVTLRGEVLGIVELAEMLNLPRPETLPEVLSVVVIHDNDRRLGLVVDRLLERQEIVIKPLGSYLGDLNGISGATIMGDGSVILILDPHEMYMMATSRAIS